MDNRSKWPSDQTTAAVHADIALRLRQVLMKFSLASGSLPSSLFLSGVSCQDKEPLYGGSFADISLGEYRSKVVALKRLRVFQIASPKDTLQLRKVFECLAWTLGTMLMEASTEAVTRTVSMEELTPSTHPPCYRN